MTFLSICCIFALRKSFSSKKPVSRSVRKISLLAIAVVLIGCGKQTNDEPGAVKFSTFSQNITSPTQTLNFAVNQQVSVPVTIQNTSKDVWYSAGKFPVNISYKWVKDNQVLPIEGLRTHLPVSSMKPGESNQAQVTVLAPSTAGAYELDITLLQEGVAWFSLSGGTPLKVACDVH